ncbi:MAG: calcium/sodium antiporter [Phycisphaerae bacterium]|nr:calcium/sodium antiporter [Phycisphaerae bacterium]
MLAELIPDSFFIQAGDHWQGWLWLMAAGAIVLLVYGADRAISAAVRMAAALGVSTVIIGATVVSLGTTAPETATSVSAALAGKPGLALGNGVGSVICNMALIFGLSCCLTQLPKDRFILRRHGWLQLGSGVLLAVIIGVLALLRGDWTGVMLPRWAGAMFLVLLCLYMYLSARWAKQHPDMIPDEARQAAAKVGHGPKEVFRDLLFLAVGLAIVVLGSQVMVGSASQICLRYGVPPDVLAVTLVAFGTSLPEFVTAIASILKGHPELLVGNIIGANILNVLFVIGASAAAVPLRVSRPFFYLHLPVMLAALALFRLYVARKNNRFERWQGVPLLLLFGGYYAALFVLVATGVLKMTDI